MNIKLVAYRGGKYAFKTNDKNRSFIFISFRPRRYNFSNITSDPFRNRNKLSKGAKQFTKNSYRRTGKKTKQTDEEILENFNCIA